MENLMNVNNFSERYKGLNNTDLLNIIENAKDYQPLAVTAGQIEINRRKLTAEEFANAKADLDLRRYDIENKLQNSKVFRVKVKTIGLSIINNFIPIHNSIPSTVKYIKIISLFLGGLFLYTLYTQFEFLQFAFSDEENNWDISTFVFFLPWIILPTTGILFWLKKKSGWMLAAAYFCYTLAGALIMFIEDVQRKPTGIQAFDNMFPPLATYIGTLVLFGGFLRILCKTEIRLVYRINKNTMYLITIGAGISTALLMFILF
jgi:hypothetical protein